MLRLKNITKDYKVADNVVHALQGVTLNFRENEFVSVLGPSGCGKTTLLNIIGGLDHYTSGDLVICGKSTMDYKDRDWDVYRNHRIGFVFQSYNLIPHQTVLGNVELALTIAGISKAERKRRATEALEKVGLGAELNKRPNQLSGGQMQRVAIARALVNNPEILLADEPTGALDTTTSLQIMELIREIAGERLVIMVTHNPEIAEQYSSRIVRLQDGLVIDDTNPYEPAEEYVKEEIIEETLEEDIVSTKKKKTKKEKASMSFKTALGLSARNLLTKKGRTAITSVAGSIGIISVCLVLALSNGFNGYILKTEEDMLSYNPVEINEKTMDITAIMSGMDSLDDIPELDKIGDRVYVNSFLTNIANGMQVENNLSDEYISYLDNMPEENYTAIQYSTGVSLVDNLYTSAMVKNAVTGKDEKVNLSLSALKAAYVYELKNNPDAKDYSDLIPLVEYLGEVVNVMPGTTNFADERFSDYVLSQYDVVKGEFPKNENEAVLVIGGNNDVTDLTLVQLGLLDKNQFFSFANDTRDEYDPYVDFDKVLNQEYTLFYNDAIYSKYPDGSPIKFHYEAQKASLDADENSGAEIRVAGILRLKEGRSNGCLASGLNLTEALVKKYVDKNCQSQIANWMNTDPNASTSLLTMTDNQFMPQSVQLQMYAGDLKSVKRVFGADNTVNSIKIYTEDFEMKDRLLSFLDEWNDTHEEADQVQYTDTVGLMMGMVETILNAITYVLVAFTAISLVVSSVMIGIITFVSVVERTKEIGVLRSLGARKRDIRNLFNAETFIIGLTSGLFGVGVTYLLSLLVNLILGSLTGISTLASLPVLSAFIMVCVSVGLTLISGLIPARAAARKDPVIALRTE
ncbi:MAG: ABC transporter ATP-binding protein/permease [Clostridiales bacterium]|nr:ABC transporter ATP-binding protein/permease [Clostridiales bacterium]